ncbi:MAG: glycosyltransferase family 2 protein [Lachnospiraceae bacterium]|nr:glycosyltransferase family 2 protein [Lachnospiraceae bacterium]
MREGLTVVVPNYNKAGYLEKCIESIESQTLRPDAVIIVDDCSTDGSGSVIDGLTKRYPDIRAHYKPRNSGVSNTRNLGLSMVDTRYVTFIDADDHYRNREKLALEMALEEEKGGDVIAYSVTCFMDSDGKTRTKKKNRSYYLNGNVYQDLLITRKWDSIMRDYIVSTETLRALGGYNEGRSLFEDYELLLKLARDHEFYCTGEFGTAYTEGGGLSQVDAKETDMIHDEIINKELERVDESTRRSILFRRKLLKIKRRIRSLI